MPTYQVSAMPMHRQPQQRMSSQVSFVAPRDWSHAPPLERLSAAGGLERSGGSAPRWRSRRRPSEPTIGSGVPSSSVITLASSVAGSSHAAHRWSAQGVPGHDSAPPPRVATAAALGQAAPVVPPPPPVQAFVGAAGEDDGEVFDAGHRFAGVDAEYAGDILERLFREEHAFPLPRSDYMQRQAEINETMRGILVDWLVEVHAKWRLRRETLFLTVNLIDRYLSITPVERKRLQLVGVVCLLIASKFEEIDPPRVSDFVYITDNAYTKEDVLRMEGAIFVALEYRVSAPTGAHYLDQLQRANECDARHQEVSEYLLELGLVNLPLMTRTTPSRLVAAALLLSNELLRRIAPWPPHMARLARLSEAQLRPVAETLRGLLRAAPQSKLQATRKKFMSAQRHSVARLFQLPHTGGAGFAAAQGGA